MHSPKTRTYVTTLAVLALCLAARETAARLTAPKKNERYVTVPPAKSATGATYYGVGSADPLIGPVRGAAVDPFLVHDVEVAPGQPQPHLLAPALRDGPVAAVVVREITPKVVDTLVHLDNDVQAVPQLQGLFVFVTSNVAEGRKAVRKLARERGLKRIATRIVASMKDVAQFRLDERAAGVVATWTNGAVVSSVGFRSGAFCNVLGYSLISTFRERVRRQSDKRPPISAGTSAP